MKRLSNERGSWTLIGLLVVVAIGFAFYALVVAPKGKEDSRRQQLQDQTGVTLNQNKSIPGAAMDAGKQSACLQQLGQIRQGIAMYKTNNEDNNPATLSDLHLGVGSSYFTCPLGHEPYQYDPNTGTVRCPHPGHERL